LHVYRAFDDVHELLLKQAHRPWIKRYLKRDEILEMIAACDAGLTEALGRFSVNMNSFFFSFFPSIGVTGDAFGSIGGFMMVSD
jgi:hypothetical protein